MSTIAVSQKQILVISAFTHSKKHEPFLSLEGKCIISHACGMVKKVVFEYIIMWLARFVRMVLISRLIYFSTMEITALLEGLIIEKWFICRLFCFNCFGKRNVKNGSGLKSNMLAELRSFDLPDHHGTKIKIFGFWRRWSDDHTGRSSALMV